jgi:DNA-binding MarR family transcriptional regulator
VPPAARIPPTGVTASRARAAGPQARDQEIIEHLFALVDRLRGEFEAAVARFDLSAPQAKALRYLAHAGPVPMRDLAGGLHCDASNVTGIVDRLEQRGLVERRASPGDRRVRSLVVTREGAVVARKVWADVLAGSAVLVGLTEAEQVTLLVLLRRLDAGPTGRCWISPT